MSAADEPPNASDADESNPNESKQMSLNTMNQVARAGT
jgi:hypothetical protein